MKDKRLTVNGERLTEVGCGSLEILEALEALEILESLETPEALKTLIPSGLPKPPWRATDPQGLQTRGRRTKKEGPSRIAPQRTLESKKNGGYLLSHGCAVPSARAGLTSLFGMGRGGTPPL